MRRSFRVAVLPLAFLVLLAFGGANGQPPAKTDELPSIKSPGFPDEKSLGRQGPKTVEELVTKLEELKKQKAEIEKLEKVLIEELKKAQKLLEERLAKLGVLPPPPIVDAPLAIFPGSAPPRQK